MLTKIRAVLIHNSHPGNIGSSARALKNMGLSSLYLVSPKKFPSKEALYMSSRAEDIVENAVVVETVQEAIQDCHLVFGASARTRKIPWVEKTPKQAADLMLQSLSSTQGEIAILYGCEQNGLSNEELELSHYQIVIPAIPHYSSLNVAQAVQVISYEIYAAYLERIGSTNELETKKKEENLATQQELENFYAHLEEVLVSVKFIEKEKPGLLLSRLRRLFARAQLEQVEVNILRGILTTIGKRV